MAHLPRRALARVLEWPRNPEQNLWRTGIYAFGFCRGVCYMARREGFPSGPDYLWCGHLAGLRKRLDCPTP
jgi:hypothetical protein